MLVLTESQVRSCLPLSLALQASSHAFYTAAHGTSTTPPRIVLSIPPPASSPATPASHTLFKPSLTPAALGVKIVSVRPSNAALSLPTVPASMLLVSISTGEVIAHIAGTALTALRTAAGSGVATQLFASPSVTAMAVFGAGAQAEAHVRVMLLVRPHCRTVHVINRSAARAQTMIERLQREHAAVSFQATILSGDEPSQAEAELLTGVVSSCQLICLCTAARRPVLRASMVSFGTHINAVGSYTPDCAEMEGELVQRCRVVVDGRRRLGQRRPRAAAAGRTHHPQHGAWLHRRLRLSALRVMARLRRGAHRERRRAPLRLSGSAAQVPAAVTEVRQRLQRSRLHP